MQCYFVSGRDRKGKWEPVVDVVRRDKSRAAFIERIKNDDTFRTKTLGWEDPVEACVKDYAERGKLGGGHIGLPNKKTNEYMMCTSMYSLGTELDKTAVETTVKTEEGFVPTTTTHPATTRPCQLRNMCTGDVALFRYVYTKLNGPGAHMQKNSQVSE